MVTKLTPEQASLAQAFKDTLIKLDSQLRDMADVRSRAVGQDTISIVVMHAHAYAKAFSEAGGEFLNACGLVDNLYLPGEYPAFRTERG